MSFSMRFNLVRKGGLAVFVALLGLLSLAPRASAQADWPDLQGSARRPGHSTDPIGYGSGRTILQWFTPTGIEATTTMILDNTDFQNTSTFPNGPYDPNIYGVVFDTAGTNVTWQSPPNFQWEATDPYREVARLNSTPPDLLDRSPDYYYALCTPSTVGDNTSAIDTTYQAAFSWQFLPKLYPDGTTKFVNPFTNPQPQAYALYVWLPEGPTGDGLGNFTFPQQYFVYKITYGTGQTFIDIVDTYNSGFGWVRLGNGGRTTNAVFSYDGADPITIELLNTIPRDALGNLTGTATQCVYADAARAVPMTGTYTASPVSGYVRDINGNPIVDTNPDIDILNSGETSTLASRIVVAENLFGVGFGTSQNTPVQQSRVSCIQQNPQDWTVAPTATLPGVPTVLWSYSPLFASIYSNLDVDATLAGDNVTAGWTHDTANPSYQGTYYLSDPLVIAADFTSATQTVTFGPTSLNTGQYAIYAYVPGNGGGQQYGDAVQYAIYYGTPPPLTNIALNPPVYVGSLDETKAAGWVQIGNAQLYNHINPPNTGAAQLTVVFYNVSTDGTNDTGKLAYVNAVKFVAGANLSINSTPIIAQVHILKAGNPTPVLTQVSIVEDESGKIHCLDYLGNGDGTTTEYWSYPSTPDPSNPTWTDPNLTNGIDGPASSTVPVAQMPTQFNLSTAVVRHLAGDPVTQDRLYIASTNGRIYCLDMTGRGDYLVAKNLPGSTARLWSYPDDYPVAIPKLSKLGAFRGSLVYGDAADGLTGPTIFAASPQGRVYSLDAAGNQANRTTTVNWAFPAVTAPVISPIEMTPALAFGNLYFGTLHDQNNDGPGVFYAISATTGAQQWYFNGVTNGASLGTNLPATAENVTDFICGPATAPQTMLDDTTTQVAGYTYPIVTQDSVYVLNDNEHLYGFNAHNGAFINSSDGFRPYDDVELGVTSTANLGFEWITTGDRFYRTNLITRSMPVITVPTAEGHVYSLFANTDDFNYFSTTTGNSTEYTSLTAWGYNLAGTVATSAAFSNRKMIVNDDQGYMYVFDTDVTNRGLEVAGNAPGQSVSPPNVPGPADAFRFLHIKLVTQSTYEKLRETTLDAVTGGANGNIDYQDTVNNGGLPLPSGQTKYAFEWGQTAYILVYGFDYAILNAGGHQVTPPMVNIKISIAGKVVRQLQVDSARFSQSTASPALYNPSGLTWPASWTGLQDGYGVIAFTFQGGGPNALPPGIGTITADITTAALNTGVNGASQEIASDPNPKSPDTTTTDGGAVSFQTANPLAIQMTSGGGGQAYLMGAPSGSNTDITSTYDLASLVNGSPAVFSYGNTYLYNQLMQSAGYAVDGTTVNTTLNLYDRSLMCLIRPPGKGLDGVRLDRTDLQWQGGATTVYNPLSPTLYPGFEDLPIFSPNNSLDYPDLTRDSLQFVINPNGAVANPVLTLVSLNPPVHPGDGAPLTEGNIDPTNYTRVLVPTPLQATINVPKYQPGNNYQAMLIQSPSQDDLFSGYQADSASNKEIQGYYGIMHVYVDSNGTGQLSDQESYRLFHLAAGITPSWRLLVDTPNVDLGSVATGTGYSPSNPLGQSANPLAPGPFNPWTGTWSSAYKPFTVLNDGNINDLNIRLAKAQDVLQNGFLPWEIYSGGNDILAWLDATTDLWSDLDSHFSLLNPNGTGGNAVILQKPRVADLVGNALDVNPHARLNPNTGAGGTGPDLNTNYDASGLHKPVVGVSLPLGFPAGTYSSSLKVIEDLGANPEIWDPLTLSLNSVEPFSDPGVNFSFTVREARVTNTSTPNTAFMADNLLPNPFTFRNITPAGTRDAFGSLIAAWASDRVNVAGNPSFTGGATAPPANDMTRLYVASVANGAQFHTNSPSTGLTVPTLDPIIPGGVPPSSPLRDLGMFTPGSGAAANTWFGPQTNNGYPDYTTTSAKTLFNIVAPDNVVGGTEKYNLPAFPPLGERDPLWQIDGNANQPFFANTFMAFVGSVQKSTQSGNVPLSQVFLSKVTTASNGGVTLDATPTAVADDATTTKGKPSVVQTAAGGAIVFYPVTSGGQTTIHADRYTGSGFAPYVGLDFGSGFESATDPSANARPYTGSNTSLPTQLIDLTFSGRLRGRPNSEIYLGRLRYGVIGGAYHLIDSTGADEEVQGAGSPFAFMPEQVNERLLNEGNGVFRARGVEWDRTKRVLIAQYQNDGTFSNVVDPATVVVDRQTGLISYDTHLGGKVYIDPDLGTVRFTGGMPSQSAEIRLTYTPAFLRVTNGGPSGYSDPNGLYDDHYVGFDPGGTNFNLWRTQGGGTFGATNDVQSGRTVFLFGKAASGNGQTARPYMTTMRFGLRLPTRIATQPGGAIVSLVVTGNLGPYEMDPANGRVYFTAVDEDNPNVTVTYTGVNEADGSQISGLTASGTISYVLEKDETPVLIDEAVNEGSINAFLDPFTYSNGASTPSQRPLLVWMFYTSTRAGGPDIYFQTIAPSLWPVVK